MDVAELIEHLQKFDPKTSVHIADIDANHYIRLSDCIRIIKGMSGVYLMQYNHSKDDNPIDKCKAIG